MGKADILPKDWPGNSAREKENPREEQQSNKSSLNPFQVLVETLTEFEEKQFIMAKKALAKDQIVKLIVGAGQASPSPPVGPALGSKGVKSMDFCKASGSILSD